MAELAVCPPCCTVRPDGVRVALRLTPKSSADRIIGMAEDAAGHAVLKVAVTAPPEGGRANAALLALLADTLRLPRRDLAVVLGAADRRKTVHVSGDPAALMPRIEAGLRRWLQPG